MDELTIAPGYIRVNHFKLLFAGFELRVAG